MFSSLGQVPLAHMSSDMSPALLAPNPAWWEGTAGIQFWRDLYKRYTLAGQRRISPVLRLQGLVSHVMTDSGLAQLLGTFYPVCVLRVLVSLAQTQSPWTGPIWLLSP